MVATWNPAAPVAYYRHQTEYYVGGVEARGNWYAPGRDFGLIDGADVDDGAFERLYAGVGPDGAQLADQSVRADRIPAYDITFSAPKSISLAWAFADPDLRRSIEASHAVAVRQALAALETNATYARRGRGGTRIEPVALTAALFQHGESRPVEHPDGRVFADPNLHTHAVIFNQATRKDGSVGALHSVILRQWKMATGAVYHAALASELRALGFEIDRIGKNGIFELTGLDEHLIEYFSGRRTEIEAALAEHGVESKDAVALAGAIAKATRGGKEEHLSGDPERIWREAAQELGIETNGFSAVLRSDRPVDLAAGEELLAERLVALPRMLTETESVVDRQDLVAAVATAVVGTGLPAARIDAEVDRLLASGSVVEIGRDRLGLPRYSTPEMIAIEKEIVDRARRLTRLDRHGLDADEVDRRCTDAGLSEEQSLAALAATGPAAIVIVEGAPGSGKTTTLAPIVAAYKEAGFRVIGASSAWRVANDLRDDLQIEARATAAWLEGARHGVPFLDSSTILVVDEAGLLASREMVALLREVEAAGAKAILVGDRQQLQAIGAGSGLRLVSEAVDAARVDTIVRQHEPWMRDAVRAFGAGHANDALDAFAEHGQIVEAEGTIAAVETIVSHWAAGRTRANDPLILARTNAQVATISRAIREYRREAGEITGADVDLPAVTPSGHSTKLTLAAGDRIRFLVRNDDLGVVNGTTALVSRVEITDSTAGSLRIHADIGGRKVTFDPRQLADDKGRIRLGWSYASTNFLSQGTTVDKAIVLLDPGFDRHAVYVAASRARSKTVFVIDAKAIDRQIAADGATTSGCVSTPEIRRAWLADRLDRANVKETTLDVIAPVKPVVARGLDRNGSSRARERTRTNSREISLE